MIIALDLDGVMADFEKGVETMFNMTIPPKGTTDPKEIRDRDIIFDLISNTGSDFWANLEMMPDAKILHDFILKNCKDFFVLTAHPKTNTEAAIEGKMVWCQKFLNITPNDKNFICCKAVQKQNYINHLNEPAILVDDMIKNINQWNDNGGTSVHHKNAISTIIKLQEIQNGKSSNTITGN